jgi:hypothetical protein
VVLSDYLEGGFGGSSPQILILAVPIPPPVEGRGQEPDGIKNVGLATVVLADEHGQVGLEDYRTFVAGAKPP